MVVRDQTLNRFMAVSHSILFVWKQISVKLSDTRATILNIVTFLHDSFMYSYNRILRYDYLMILG